MNRCPKSTICAEFTYSQTAILGTRGTLEKFEAPANTVEWAEDSFPRFVSCHQNTSRRFSLSLRKNIRLTFTMTHLPTSTNFDPSQTPTTQANSDGEIRQMAERLVQLIRSLGSVAVAYSGGVDSAVVACASVLAVGDRAVAVTAVSPSLANGERQQAAALARSMGIRHVEIPTNEFENADYRANAGNRCFFCKDTLYRLSGEQRAELGVEILVNGTNVDDLGDYRPGLKAAEAHQVRSPLVEIGCRKSMVRELARHWQLTVADKPASPCLSSRVAYGIEVTPERVRRIELAEAFVRQWVPDGNLRVRCESGEAARIEVDPPRIADLQRPERQAAVIAELQRLGFRSVTIDPAGFRSGNLNQSLTMVPLNTPE